MKKIIWLLFLGAAFSFKANAQCNPCIDCVDSTRINPFFTCVKDYEPYCGCDGNWYRNECVAYQQNGINCAAQEQSCCPPLDFYILPNLVTDLFSMQVYLRNGLSGFINIRLIDSYGKLWNSQNIYFNSGDQPRPVDLNLGGLRTGMYYIFVQSQGMTLWQKFVKI